MREQERVAIQVESKPSWTVHESVEGIVSKLREEVEEVAEVIEKFEVFPDAEANLAMEIGDVGFLLMSLCNQVGLDFNQCINDVLIKNDLQYPTALQTNGLAPKEALKKSKLLFKASGGHHALFEAMNEVED